MRINKLPYSQKQKKGQIFSLKSKKGWKLQSPSTKQDIQNPGQRNKHKRREELNEGHNQKTQAAWTEVTVLQLFKDHQLWHVWQQLIYHNFSTDFISSLQYRPVQPLTSVLSLCHKSRKQQEDLAMTLASN